MTNTIDVAALVERLTAGKSETPDYEVVWVQNMRAFIDSDMFRTFPEWRKIFREEFDNLLTASAEAATALQAQADALAEARRNEWPFGKRPNPVCGYTFTDFAVYGDEKSIKRVRAAMHEYDAMMPARIERIKQEVARATTAEAEARAMREALEAARKYLTSAHMAPMPGIIGAQNPDSDIVALIDRALGASPSIAVEPTYSNEGGVRFDNDSFPSGDRPPRPWRQQCRVG